VSWADSLIRISTYEAETLQKRLAEVVDRRVACEMRLTMLDAEGEAERMLAPGEAAMYHASFVEGLKLRKARVQAEIETILIEERGARDALAEAFEAQKKYEHISEAIAAEKRRKLGQLEAAALDELGLRRAAR